MARRLDILASKISPPRVGVPLLPRPRLLPLVRDALTKTLLVLSAEAGYGKTCLLLSMLADLDAPVAWLTLDESDADPNLFSAGLVSAVRAVAPHFGDEVLPVLTTGPSVAVLRARLLRALDALSTTVIVLDDFHSLDRSRDALDLVDQLLSALPSPVHLIMATRTWPDLPSLPRLLVQGEAAIIDRARLGFDVDETAMFFRHSHGLTLPDDQVRGLASRTEGWPAALQLVALVAKERGRVPHEGTPREIFDYLATTVLRRLPDDVQEFLLRTSIFSEFWPSVCRAVTDDSDPAAVLNLLERENLFVYRLDDAGPRFRYHQLFAEFLQQQLALRGREVVTELHRRAGRRLEEEGLPERAVRHYIAAEAYDDAERVMKPIHGDRLTAREAYVFRDILSRLPEEILAGHPWMARSGASSCRFVGDYQRALTFARQAMTAAEGRDLNLWAFSVHGVGVMYSHLDRYQDAVTLCRHALERITTTDLQAGIEPRMIVGILTVLTDALLQLGELGEASRGRQRLADASTAGTQLGKGFGAEFYAGVIASTKLEFTQATGHFARAMEMATARGSLITQTSVMTEMAAAELGRRSITAATDSLRRAHSLHAQTGERATDLRLTHLAGDLHLLRGDLTAAEQAFHHTLSRCREDESEEPKVWSMLGLSKVARARHNVAEAETVLQAAEAICRRVALGKLLPILNLERAALLYEAGREDEAVAPLEAAGEVFRRWDAPVALAWCGSFLAQVQWRLAGSDRLPDAARTALAGALTTGGRQADDFLPLLRREAAWTVRLLIEALRDSIEAEAARTLLQCLGPSAVEALIEALKEPELRLRAIPLLGQIGDPRARRPLARLSTSGDAAVRSDAARAMTALRSPEPAALRIRMFGTFQVARDGALIDDRAWKTQKVKTLLKYLLLRHDQTVHQDQVIDLLWPDAEPAAGPVNLKTAVKTLRQALEPLLEGTRSHYVRRDGDLLRFVLAPTCWIDLDEYGRLASDARQHEDAGDLAAAVSLYQQAAALYRGDLLEDDRYDDWVTVERERRRERHLELLSALAGVHARRKDFRSAVETVQQILSLDRLRESGYRDLIHYSLQRGDQIAAVRAYQTCEQILREELGVAPQAETLALLSRAGLSA